MTTRITAVTLGLALAVTTALSAAPAAPRDTRLVDAVKAGNTAAATALLARKVDVNAPEADGSRKTLVDVMYKRVPAGSAAK